MIWLITLVLLAVTAWLILNGINEKQWVDAHRHDENVAKDDGLFDSFSSSSQTAAKRETSEKIHAAVSNIKTKSAEAKEAITQH